ncbi:hypothetical protein EYZ11_009888 [Aspergillus tanneri]|uniref:Uncharacterized protein n=1 Tax=Aspergillus tanneri TaxID=1220188 RepID=A0A4V6RQQ1_9EURO|nr:hypothetical protein EYZ11_009888 [Aspergillus tanneri]
MSGNEEEALDRRSDGED